MYEITIKGNTPAELFANLAQMAAANTNAAPAAIPQIPTAPALVAVSPTVAQPPVAAPAAAATVPSATPAPANPAPAPAPVAPAPVAAPAPTATAPAAAPAPVVPAPVAAPAAVPTAAPTYTLDALARAGAALAQAGKMQEALALLAKYGVQTVNQLKPEQYGAFATELRALGAQI